MHDFTGVPRDLLQRVEAMRATGAEVVKIAVTATRLTDCLALLPFTRDLAVPTVVLAMGEAGVPTRVLASRFGSCWTYAGDGVAPGQQPVSRLHDEFGYRRIGRGTAIYGLLGKPVSHSVSPAMHNAAFRASGIDAVYVPFEGATFDDFAIFADALGVAGASVTAPFKVDAFDRADESDAVSRRIRSVNTLKRDGRRWLGCNTDVAGFLSPLLAAMPIGGARATVLGAGGAARSVAVALASAGARVSIAARNAVRGAEVCGLTGAAPATWPPPPSSWDLLVNATPVGTHPEVQASPIPSDLLTGTLVYDLVYNPIETRLMREAHSRGCRTIGGLDMLIAQAQDQFDWWTGTRPPDRVMREAAIARLAEVTPS
jgi:3-dehydroquinate dehydratase/shikimate dehydrogenase